MAGAGQRVLGFGCEPVRKNNVGITPPRHTLWSRPTPVANFLEKLYDPEAEYTAEDDVIQLHPPTVQHDQAIAEDPGCIDADLFNFDEHAFCDRTGINPEMMVDDDVIKYSIDQLAQLYRINTFLNDQEVAWQDEDSPHAQLCSLHRPSVTVYQLNPSQDVAGLSPETIANFSTTYLEPAPYSVFICHWGNHYFTVGYNNAIESGEKHLYVTDSNVGEDAEGAVSRKFAAKFHELWNRIDPPPGVQLLTFFKDYLCEQQEDDKSCALYAIHNAHRLVHAATIGGNFEQVGTNKSPFAVELGQLTPQKIRVWRTKLFKAYHEYERQKALRITFADNATIRATPGYHPSHDFIHRFKVIMTPQTRADIGFIGPGGIKVSEYCG
ncbi:hypothetical protein EV426DRAFT_139310 [Tirmania nivea]|nr:hypothetical protein EV426DRAFT_139310 [Tirmania nivea]